VVDRVVSEQAVTVMVDKVGSFTIMCTPSDLEALAVGFVYSEGMIDGMEDVIEVLANEQTPKVIGIRVQDPSRVAVRRNLIVASSCGVCGARNVEKMFNEMPACKQTLEVHSSLLIRVSEDLRNSQEIFRATGGSHAAGIFEADGRIICLAEDIGRHTALDKAIGKGLLAGRSLRGCGLALSSRVSWEMVSKAARAGIEIVAGVSAPSSLAIEAAERWNITLCGFVRATRASVYAHPERITDLRGHRQTAITE
jgi:FdhD protein